MIPCSCDEFSASAICAVIERAARGGEAVLAAQAVRQRLALQVLHHEVEFAIGRVAEVGDVDDVLVADLVDRLGLRHEAGDHVGVLRELRVDGLHRHLFSDNGVLRQVDDPHPPFTQLGGDLVVPDRVADIDHEVADAVPIYS